MKSTFLSILLAIVLPLVVQPALASGTVTFANQNAVKVINGQTLSPITVAEGVKAALYWAPEGSINFVQIGNAVTVGVPLAGIYCGGTRTAGPETPGGATGQFQVRVWGGGAAAYEQAAITPGALIGQSAILHVV